MINLIETIYTDIAELNYNKKECILNIKILENASITIETLKNHIKSINDLTNYQQHFSLVDATNFFSIDDESLKYLASPETNNKIIAEAFYSTNLANRLTLHFFKLFHKPHYPTQLFRYKAEAINWLDLCQTNSPYQISVNQ